MQVSMDFNRNEAIFKTIYHKSMKGIESILIQNKNV